MPEIDSSPNPSEPSREPPETAITPAPEVVMERAQERAPDQPEDEPQRAEMPFLDHLEELRWRILKAAGAVLVGALVCFAFSDPILKVLTRPYEQAVRSTLDAGDVGPAAALQAWVRQQVNRWHSAQAGAAESTAAVPSEGASAAPSGGEAEADAVDASEGSPDQLDLGEPDQATAPAGPAGIPPTRQLQSLRPMTYFFVSLQVALLGGLVLALPVVFYQFWRFVAPGLLSRERRLVLPVVTLSVLCFGLGAAIAYSIVLPLGLRFFLGLEPDDMTSQWAVDEYISFVLRLLLGFGIVFEMPVVTLLLSRLGLVTPAYMRRVRRYAIVAIFVLAAVFTPPDPISQILMALPLLALYEVSIWVCRLTHRRPADT